ncbi:MAG: hypothetical protein E6R04_05875 [Spirochaetes bacterium]|nr:MAG: hypothetical protein E6R04_05875 [Spirochaetota bacterium]
MDTTSLDLEAILILCQKYGVRTFSNGQLRFTLTKTAPSQSSGIEAPEVDFAPKVSEPLLGTDNLTAQEQIELYGRVYDAKG